MLYKQKAAQRIGEEGCYFLSLIFVAEQELKRDIDALAIYGRGVGEGWMREDCYMERPGEMMRSLLGVPCSVRKSHDFSERIGPNEWDIWRYERETAGATYCHFAVVSEGVILYDPLGSSETIAHGKPASRRIVTIGRAG